MADMTRYVLAGIIGGLVLAAVLLAMIGLVPGGPTASEVDGTGLGIEGR